MKFYSITILLLMFTCFNGISQQGEVYRKLPRKYEMPSLRTSTDISFNEGKDPWRVYADRDSILVYETSELNIVSDTIYFMDDFVVWEEAENAVRIVADTGSGNFLEGDYFGISSHEAGWVEKSNLILWPRVLKENNINIKAIFNKTTYGDNYLNGKHSNDIIIQEGELKIFNILKIQDRDILLCKTDLMHKELTKDDLFWIQSSKAKLIIDRKGLIPAWKKIKEGNYAIIFDSYDELLKMTNPVDTIKIVNPFLGFLNTREIENHIYEAKPIMAVEHDKVFINNLNKTFQMAHLIDYNQFLVLYEFINIFYNSLLKEELEDKLFDFFLKWGVSEEEINAKNLCELLNMVSEIEMTNIKADEVIKVSNLSENHYRTIYDIYNKSYENFTSENILSMYRFYSDMNYFWVPEEWIMPAILSGLKISGTSTTYSWGPVRKIYSEYDLIYIDNSDASEEKSFEQLQAEIRRIDVTLSRILRNASSNATAGHLLFYSNSTNPIAGTNQATFNNIVLEMRMGNSARPNLYLDKYLLEKEILFRDVEKVEKEVSIHCFLSNQTWEEELSDRPFLTFELMQRLKSMIAKDAEMNVFFYLFNTDRNSNLEQSINQRINDWSSKSRGIKYNLSKYN